MQKASRPFTARPYQTLITNHILEVPRCAVWASMGVGKSCATLNAISALQMMEDMPTLVLAPLRVARDTWPDEGKKWDHTKHLRIVPIVGTAAQRLAAVYQPADIHTINYENLPWLVAHYGDKWPYRMLVLDESTKVKGFRLKQGGMRAKALAQVAHLKVKRLVELTGTPASNGLKDLWGQAWFLDVGQRLGRTYTSFTQRWFRPSPDGFGIEPLAHSQAEIQDRMRDLCITVEAKDWFDLREPIVTNLYVDLPIKARKQYAAMEKEMFLALDSGHEIEAFNAASRTIKCLQLCIAEGTEVLTRRGWVPIETVRRADLVWDGHEWAECSGVIAQGVQSVIDCWGVQMTPGHRVLTTTGWKTAEEISNDKSSYRLDRSNFRLPYGDRPSPFADESREVAGTLRLRGGGCADRHQSAKSESRRKEVLRLSSGRNAFGRLGHSRYDAPPNHAHVGWHAPALRQPIVKGLGQLRRARHYGLRAVGRFVRELHGGHAADMAPRIVYRTHQKRRGVLARELCVGDTYPAGQQSTGERHGADTPRLDDGCAGRAGVRSEIGNATTTPTTGLARAPAVRATFDIANVGVRNQFMVRGACGPFIVHNCNGAIYTGEPGNNTWETIHDEKIQALESIVEEAAGSPVLVAYHFKSDLARLKKAFPAGQDLATAKGMAAFKTGQFAVGFGHPAGMGHGVDGLQEHCHTIAYFSVNWNLEEHLQVLERIGPTRQFQAGKDRAVFVYRILARNTVDEMVVERLDTKRSVQDILMAAMKEHRKLS